MARISGVELPNKRAEIALTYIYGIGKSLSRKVLNKVKISFDKRINDLNDKEINSINKELAEKDYLIEGDLRNQYVNSIKRLMQVNCFRGQRHQKKLPVRGQRTRTNAKTRKGKGRAIANKKIASK